MKLILNKIKDKVIIRLGYSIKKDFGEVCYKNFYQGKELANRTSIINHLIKKFNLKSYLEIGVKDLKNFEKIKVNKKIGIDPFPTKKNKMIYVQTSDDFFLHNKKKFDLIFIDGLHLEEQVDKDIYNSLKFLSNDGFIIMHDCNPRKKVYQLENPIKNEYWNGTTWKSFVKLRMTKINLKMLCIDVDHGIGIIQKGKQKLIDKKKLTFENLENNRHQMLNLTSIDKFLEIYQNRNSNSICKINFLALVYSKFSKRSFKFCSS